MSVALGNDLVVSEDGRGKCGAAQDRGGARAWMIVERMKMDGATRLLLALLAR